MKSVIYILSLGHSGSTILGDFLGAHPQIIHLGELVLPLRKGRQLKCFYCDGSPCPIWGSLISKKTMTQCYQAFSSSRKTPVFVKKIKSLLSFKPSNRQASKIYREAFSKEGIDALVDSSKNIEWLIWNSNNQKLRHKVVFLTRDLRGVVASRKRKYSSSSVDVISNDVRNEVTKLAKQIKELSNIEVLQLRYEDLVAFPNDTGRRLSLFCGVPFHEDMLRFYEKPSHIIGGNIGPTIATKKLMSGSASVTLNSNELAEGKDYYLSVSPGLHLDERWKTELTSTELESIDRVLGEINSDFGYK